MQQQLTFVICLTMTRKGNYKIEIDNSKREKFTKHSSSSPWPPSICPRNCCLIVMDKFECG